MPPEALKPRNLGPKPEEVLRVSRVRHKANPKMLETGLRTTSAGIPYTRLVSS